MFTEELQIMEILVMWFLHSSASPSFLWPIIQPLHDVLCFYSKQLLPSQTKRIYIQKGQTMTLKQTEVTVESKHTYNGNHL
jgi:hypothetical protein